MKNNFNKDKDNNMIQITNSGSIVIQPDPFIADGVWVSNLTVNAPMPNRPIVATITVVPFNSISGSICPQQAQKIVIRDIYATASIMPNVQMTMTAIFDVVQDFIKNGTIGWNQ